MPASVFFNIPSFITHFLLCNLFLSAVTGMLLLIKYSLRKYLSCRMQYAFRLLFLLPLVMPFLSFRPAGPAWFSRFFQSLRTVSSGQPFLTSAAAPRERIASSTGWMNDFSVSVNRASSPFLARLLLGFWILGMFLMLLRAIYAVLRLRRLESSGLPLQNKAVRQLYAQCRKELHIRRSIPVYSSAFFQSPALTGLFRPKIYLPISLLSSGDMRAIRYMLLHELQHYRQGDNLAAYLLCLSRIVYWFNPIVRIALREVQTDKEKACDSSVLQILPEKEYKRYGNTLIDFAEELSSPALLFANGMGGSVKQLKKRLRNISAYRLETKGQARRGKCIFALAALLLLEAAAVMPVYASGEYTPLPDMEKVVFTDLSAYFEGYDGCFVFYDSGQDSWQIYNEKHAAQRFSPDSTYKIYSALFGLENGSIAPGSNAMPWNGQTHAIPEWNRDQTLASAMTDSVNWYFQALDQEAGIDALQAFYERIGYGNHDLSGGISHFWMESSLQISALEQVELLYRFYTNADSFAPENVQAVKDALKLMPSPSEGSILYGKTGTGNVRGQNVNGWFVGYVEKGGNPCFFATNIQGMRETGGKKASEIALQILQDMGVWL